MAGAAAARRIGSKIRTLADPAGQADGREPMVRKPSPASGSEAAEQGESGERAPSFEDAIRELETLVERMESGSLSLEESLSAYRRGAELVTHCRKALAEVQQQVKVLEGELLKPFEPDTGAGGAGQ